jgi:hypothetical protein
MVNENNSLIIVETICDAHGVSFVSPEKTAVNFVVFSTLAQLYSILSTNHAQGVKITVADGVTTDLSKPVESYLKLAAFWQAEADKAAESSDSVYGVAGSFEIGDLVINETLVSKEYPPLSKPVVNVSDLTISWNQDLSLSFSKLEVYLDDETDPAFTTESMYVSQYTSPTSFDKVRVVKTDTLDRTVYTTVIL